MSKKLLLLFSFVFLGFTSQSQVLISIILGDKLNSPDLEFGVDGGLSLTSITGLESHSMAPSLHLGFYFDFRIKNQWWLNTGVLVKSSQGANKLSENDVANLYPEFTQYVDSGKFSQSFGYFNVPIMVKYRLKNQIYFEGGVQASLMTKAILHYEHNFDERDLTSSWENTPEFNRIDFGFVVGGGYKLLDGEGMNIGVKYYLGVVDITKTNQDNNYNSAIYVKVDIPIGKKKAEAARAEQEKASKSQNP